MYLCTMRSPSIGVTETAEGDSSEERMCSTKRRSIHPQLLHSSERLAIARTSKEKGQIPLLVAG